MKKLYLLIILFIGLSVLFFGYRFFEYKEACTERYNANVGIHISFDSKSDTNKVINYANSFKLLNEVKEVKVITKEEAIKDFQSDPMFANALKEIENPLLDVVDINFKNLKTVDVDSIVASLKKEAEKRSLKIDDIRFEDLKSHQRYLKKICSDNFLNFTYNSIVPKN